MEELDRKETWSTGLDEVRMMWKSQEEEVDEQRWLPTGRRMGDRRDSQEFENLCQKFENWDDGGGEE